MASVQVWEPQAPGSVEWLRGLVRRLPAGSLVVAGMERVDRLVEHVPALAWVRTRAYEIEAEALRALRDRLLQLDGPFSVTSMAVSPLVTRVDPQSGATSNAHCSPADAFATLLGASESQSPDAARRQNMFRLIDQLVPDEARILFAMADGSQFAVLQAHDGNDQIVVNRSNVGRAAKVHAQDMTTGYVTHLLRLGLVELVPYAGNSFYEWEMIETETEVREVLGRYDHRKLKKPKLERQLLRLSAAGRALCDHCIPS